MLLLCLNFMISISASVLAILRNFFKSDAKRFCRWMFYDIYEETLWFPIVHQMI